MFLNCKLSADRNALPVYIRVTLHKRKRPGGYHPAVFLLGILVSEQGTFQNEYSTVSNLPPKLGTLEVVGVEEVMSFIAQRLAEEFLIQRR
jgi:hypothetical protein